MSPQSPVLPWCRGFSGIEMSLGMALQQLKLQPAEGCLSMPSIQPFPEPPLALALTLLSSSCGRYQWQQDRKCLSSSMLQLQGLMSPQPPLAQSHSARLHQPEARILMYMHLSVCFHWGTLYFMNLPLWMVMNVILPLVFQNERLSFIHPVLFLPLTLNPTCFSSWLFLSFQTRLMILVGLENSWNKWLLLLFHSKHQVAFYSLGFCLSTPSDKDSTPGYIVCEICVKLQFTSLLFTSTHQ